MFVCQKPVKALLKAGKLCLMCCEEEGSVTMRPCGHVFCARIYKYFAMPILMDITIHQFAKTECSERMKSCFECRASVITKDDSSKFFHSYYII